MMRSVLTTLAALALLALLSLVWAAESLAQDTQGYETALEITFEEALQIALRDNVRLQQAEVAATAAADAVDVARAALLPSVSATAQPIRRYGLSFDQTTGTLQQQASDALGATVSANLNLFNGFSDAAELRRRHLERQAGQLVLARTREDLVFDVASGFLQLTLGLEIVGIREEALGAQRRQLLWIEDLVEAGVRAPSEALQQRAIVAQAELAVLDAESQVELAQTQLVRMLHLDPFREYVFVAPQLDEAATARAAFDLEALTEATLERRGDLRAQELRIRAAEAGVRVARGGYLPTVALFGSLGSSYSSLARRPIEGTGGTIPVTTPSGEPVIVGGEPFRLNTPPQFEPTPFGDQFFMDNRGGSIGITVSVPVFDRFLTRAQVRQAQRTAESERLALDDLEQEVAAQVRQALLDLRNAEKRVEVAGRQVGAAAAALTAAQDRYDLGAATLVELTLARATLVEAESAQAQARTQVVFQLRRIEYVSGSRAM